MAQPVLIEVADAPSISFRASPERQRGGELRWVNGAGMPTDFPVTLRRRPGQRAGPANYVGSLMDYNARFSLRWATTLVHSRSK